ncbi:MAG TPA: response regulator, partial [Myxococcota bacterium]
MNRKLPMNMSHELRTPLNSSLLLARLLVENKDGNLTAEQIKFAETIYEAGSDLLALINDVLDVSKIEAGRVEIRPQPVSIMALSDSMRRLFAPVAEDKGLAFVVDIDKALAEDADTATFVTDLQRLEQILKNLLSNAFKFTREGSVTLRIGRGIDRSLRFIVIDSGVGIAADKHELVFEAFRQIDDGFSRAHGGTGLGLSISRELARLLGGELTLASSEGQGSSFTLTLPLVHRRSPTEEILQPTAPVPLKTLPSSTRSLPSLASPARGSHAPPLAAAQAPSSTARAMAVSPSAPRDRRRVLIVDDDPQFSTLLVRVVTSSGNEAIVAETADDAVELARHHLPDGVLLDLHLPDHSGLSVLDRLKRDLRTRHIPVHIITGTDDDPRRALSMGAIGFTTKPLSVDTIKEAIDGMFTRQKASKRVLVIEADATQRDIVVGLLQHDNVVVQTAASAEAARSALHTQRFDCIVMDIAFPDGAKGELLPTMATADVVMPPVIVYSADTPDRSDDDRLGNVANTLVVKFARTPEQLVDEVTLFLHQAETELPPERQRMLRTSRDRDQIFDGRTLLIVEDDVRNIYALSRVLEPRGARVE